MVLPETITGNVRFLKVVLLPDGNRQTGLYALRKGKCVCLPENLPLKNRPLFVLMEGEGVLRKVYGEGEESMRRITENPALLYEREQKGQEVVLTFTRREKADEVVAGIERKGMRVYGLYLSVGQGEENSCAEEGEAVRLSGIRKREMTVRALLRTDRKGKALAECIFRRLRLPLLCFWLSVLVGNFFGSMLLEERIREQEAVLAVRVQQREGKDREDEGIRLLSEKVERWRVGDCALLLDRIAGHVPDGMQLTSLCVSPFEGKLQPGRDPELESGVVSIGGETTDPAAVTRFCRLLEREAFCREIELKNIHRLSGREMYRFEIKISR